MRLAMPSTIMQTGLDRARNDPQEPKVEQRAQTGGGADRFRTRMVTLARVSSF